MSKTQKSDAVLFRLFFPCDVFLVACFFVSMYRTLAAWLLPVEPLRYRCRCRFHGVSAWLICSAAVCMQTGMLADIAATKRKTIWWSERMQNLRKAQVIGCADFF